MDKIILKEIGNNEIAVIKDIRDLLDIDLNQAKDIVDNVKSGTEFELYVKDAKFAMDILSSDGAIVYVEGDETTGIEGSKENSNEKNAASTNNNANEKNVTSSNSKAKNDDIIYYKREHEQKICSIVNRFYGKRETFFYLGFEMFVFWIGYVFIDSFSRYHGNIFDKYNWVTKAYVHINSNVEVVGGICILFEIVGCILGMLSSSRITLTDNKVYGKSSLNYRFNISLGDIKEIRFNEKFNKLEIQKGDDTTKLLFIKSGNELKEKIDDAVYRYNNLGGRYQETRFEDEKRRPFWKTLLSIVLNLFSVYLVYIYLFAIPDVNGLSLKDAEKKLARRGIPYTKVAEFPTFTLYDKGDVCDDGGAAYLPIASVDSVVLTYIGGVTQEQLNSLPGKTLDEACEMMEEAGCELYYYETYSDTVPEGCVITWENYPDDYSGASYIVAVSQGKEPNNNSNGFLNLWQQPSSGANSNNNGNSGSSSSKKNEVDGWNIDIVSSTLKDDWDFGYNSFSTRSPWYIHFICECSDAAARADMYYVVEGSYGNGFDGTIEDVEDGDRWYLEVPVDTFDDGEDVVITVYIDGEENNSEDIWINWN